MCTILAAMEPPGEIYSILLLGSQAQRFGIIGLGPFNISPGDCNVQPRWRMIGWETCTQMAAHPLSLVSSGVI